MIETKSPLQSLTINAAVIGLVVQLLAIFGVQIAPETAMEIGTSINSIISAIAILVAIYGRLRARKAIATAAADGVKCSGLAVGLTLTVMIATALAGCTVSAPNVVSAGAEPLTDPARADVNVFVRVSSGLMIAEAAAAGIEAKTEEAIRSGVLRRSTALPARNRVVQVRSAVLVA